MIHSDGTLQNHPVKKSFSPTFIVVTFSFVEETNTKGQPPEKSGNNFLKN